jgi:hypothetical protein
MTMKLLFPYEALKISLWEVEGKEDVEFTVHCSLFCFSLLLLQGTHTHVHYGGGRGGEKIGLDMEGWRVFKGKVVTGILIYSLEVH